MVPLESFEHIDFAGAPSQRIPSGSVIDASSVAKTTIWTLAGGYTVLQGDWGNLDVIAGLRYLGVDSTTGFSLATTFTGPRGNEGVLGGSGTVTSNGNTRTVTLKAGIQ